MNQAVFHARLNADTRNAVRIPGDPGGHDHIIDGVASW